MNKARFITIKHQAELEGRHSQARAWERDNSSLGTPITKLRLAWYEYTHQAELEGRHSQAELGNEKGLILTVEFDNLSCWTLSEPVTRLLTG
jgi:hypothetical protein